MSSTTPYAQLSAQYYLDDRIVAAGEAAELLYIRGLAFSAGVFGDDGYLTRAQALRGAGTGLDGIDERISALTESGLWIPEKDGAGFRIRSWAKWNRTRAEVLAARERDAARKRAGREGSPGVSRPSSKSSRPRGVQSDSERSPNGVQRNPPESSAATTDTTDPPGHYVSRVDQAGVRAGAYPREAAPAEAAAQEPPRPARSEFAPPSASAAIAEVLAKANNRRLQRRAADGYGAP